VSGKRAYKPHRPGDLNIGDVIKYRRSGGRIHVGLVRYVGHLPGKSKPVVGLETEQASKFVVSKWYKKIWAIAHETHDSIDVK